MKVTKTVLLIGLAAFLSVAGAFGTEVCDYYFIEEVDECPGGYAFSVCTEVNPETGSVTTRVYDDGCAYVVTA